MREGAGIKLPRSICELENLGPGHALVQHVVDWVAQSLGAGLGKDRQNGCLDVFFFHILLLLYLGPFEALFVIHQRKQRGCMPHLP